MKLTEFLLALFTLALVIATSGLIWTGLRQEGVLTDSLAIAKQAAEAAERAANAAIESNKISRDAMIVDQRPWVTLDVSPSGPLAYDDKRWQGGLRWHVPLEYKLKNIGKTPATRVAFFGKMIPFINSHWPPEAMKGQFPEGPPIPGTDIPKEIEDVCGFHEGMADAKMGWGEILFPDGGREQSQFGMNADPKLFDAAKSSHGYTGQFIVVVCVTYGSTLSGDKYRTAKAFHLFKEAGTQNIDLNGEAIPKAELGFVLNPANGSYAR